MKHEPEKNAAAYLSGVMSRRRRKAFEHHILECEDCWSEVDVGRRGRSLAEAARDLAPQSLRERVRMSVAATTPPRRRWARGIAGMSAGVIVLILATVVVITSILSSTDQPREVALLVADFKSEAPVGAAAPRVLPRRLGDLQLRESRIGRVDGMSITAHEYSDSAGHEVVVYQADQAFPVAVGASHSSSSETWTAEVDGTVMYCADRPVPSLVIGDDRKEVALAAAELGLR
jgi:hypothetical protein